jgi:uncharacterized protein (TIGR00369 family)
VITTPAGSADDPDATLIDKPLPGLPGLLGIRLTHLDTSRVEATLTVTDAHLAPAGYLHAAAAVGLADTACGYGCQTSLPDTAVGFTTLELKSNLLGTARSGQHLFCTGTPAHLGRSTQIWDASLTTEDTAHPIALFRCTQLILYPK